MSGVARSVSARLPKVGRVWFTYVRRRGQVRDFCMTCGERIPDFQRVRIDRTVMDWRGLPALEERSCYEDRTEP